MAVYGNTVLREAKINKDKIILEIKKILKEENKNIYDKDQVTDYFNLSLIQRINKRLEKFLGNTKYTRYYLDTSYVYYGNMKRDTGIKNYVVSHYFIKNDKLYMIYLLLDGDTISLYDYSVKDLEYYIFDKDVIELALNSLTKDSLFILDFTYNSIYSSRIDGKNNIELMNKIDLFVKKKYSSKLKTEINEEGNEIKFSKI